MPTDPTSEPPDHDAVRASYDSVAAEYVEHLYTELEGKPLDRHLLNRFAEEVRDRGLVGDLGCGPGHVARYLHEQGVRVLGVDLSPEMIRQATRLTPGVEFRVGDLLALDLPDGSLAGIVAFYSVIHFEPAQLDLAFREMRRVLAPDGVLLVSFHVGDRTIHLDELWGRAVCLDFRFLEPGEIVAALRTAGLSVTESVEREPYEGAEYPSRRCYLLARPY
ncbi:MAG TPA: methyltransferase domain-containing protein [Thermoanaerobaculia bacterium]|jgi:SAM-dependent methyltransferase|nr:methyltransferase domain-containing protein [Thermoanaerobaculia bacterium]